MTKWFIKDVIVKEVGMDANAVSMVLWQEKRRASFEYGRYGNPTTVVVEEKIRFANLFFD